MSWKDNARGLSAERCLDSIGSNLVVGYHFASGKFLSHAFFYGRFVGRAGVHETMDDAKNAAEYELIKHLEDVIEKATSARSALLLGLTTDMEEVER